MLYADFSIRRGGVGGFFGGRLVEKGEDVTFLVRSKRKKTIRGKRTCNPKC
ncbi:2-dehydropantoate 2-reductase N-terminal domain-containing protein [Bacillus cereus]